jgi:hypothetical protein
MKTLTCFKFTFNTSSATSIVLDDVMFSVLAIGRKFRGFSAGRGRWLSKGDKSFQFALFRRVTKAGGSHVVRFAAFWKPCLVWTKIIRKAKFIISFAISSFATRWQLVGLPESSGERIRSLTLQIPFHYGSSCSYIIYGRGSQTFQVAYHSM